MEIWFSASSRGKHYSVNAEYVSTDHKLTQPSAQQQLRNDHYKF